MAELELLLLGKPKLLRAGADIPLRRRKALALLAYLAVEGPSACRETLATLLWPELPRENSLASLRRVLVSLNRALDRRVLEATRQDVTLPRNGDCFVDALAFLELLRPASPSHRQPCGPSRLSALQEAVDLYQGDFLAGFTVTDSSEFEQWQLARAQSFRFSLNNAFQELVQGLITEGDYERGLQQARRWLEQDPYVEEAHRALMRLYACSGRRTEALRQYEQCCRLLREELDVAPERETTELCNAIKADRLEPQVVRSEPAVIVAAPPSPPDISHNLPFPPNPFVGRTKELRQLSRLLTKPEVRLFTITGPGGIGKTRLAIEAVRKNLQQFPDGVIYVPLAPLHSPTLLFSTIAERLYMSLESQPDPQRQVLAFLRDRKALLLLDNFEHLMEGAHFVSEMVARSTHLKILLTSRERLNLQGEWLLEISGLEVPESDEVTEDAIENFSALRLFMETATRIRPDFAPSGADWPVISQICRRVGGMPLAIELAAGWLRMLDCSEINREIDGGLDFLSAEQPDLPARHRSLKALFHYSLGLLEQDERQAFQRLAVFRGGFDREAAESVAGASLFQLRRLLNKSLISRTTSGRFEIHELFRQYLVSLLQSAPEGGAELRRTHSRYFLGLLETLGATLFGFEEQEVVSRLRSEAENIRAAWRWAAAHQDVKAIGKAINGLYRFHLLLSSSKEGEEVMSRSVQLFETLDHQAWKVAALARQGHFALMLGEQEKSRRLLEQSHHLSRRLNHLEEVAFSLTHLTAICLNKGEYELARRYLTDSRSIYRALNNRHGTAYTLLKLGRLEGTLGTHGEARLHLNTAMGILEEVGDLSGMSRCMINLGTLAFLNRDNLGAIRMYREALEILQRLNDRKRLAICFSNLGTVYAEIGENQQAKDYGSHALKLMEEIGDLDSLVQILETMGRITRRLGERAESRHHYHRALQIASEINAVTPALNTLQGVARLLADEGDFERAFLVLSHVLHHPRVDAEAKLQAQEVLARVKARIPAAKAGKIEKCAKQINLDTLSLEMVHHFRSCQDSSTMQP